jgi:hypothetical protein
MLAVVKAKWNRWLPFIFLALVAFSRWPGLFPPSFSAVYALAFCAGVYLNGRMAWWLPLGTLLLTDVALNMYYWSQGWNVWDWPVIKYQLVNYAAYGVLIGLGRCFKPQSSFAALLGGGILARFYFISSRTPRRGFFNPFHNPEYVKNFSGWLLALTKGVGGWPSTWEFFRNTLLSGGIFTALFVAARN